MIEETREDRLVGKNIEIDKAMSSDGWQYVSHRVETVHHEHTTPGSVSYSGRVDSDGDIHLTEHVTPDHTSYWSETVYYVTYRRVFHDPSHAQDVRRWETTLTDKKADYREKEYCRNLIAASFGFEMPVAKQDLKEYSYATAEIAHLRGAFSRPILLFSIFLGVALVGMVAILILKDWNLKNSVNPPSWRTYEEEYALIESSWNIFLGFSITLVSLLALADLAFVILKIVSLNITKKDGDKIDMLSAKQGKVDQTRIQSLREELKALEEKTISKTMLVLGIIVAIFGLFELPALPNVKGTGAMNLVLGFFALFLSAGIILILIWGIRKAVRASKIKALKTKIEYLTR